jgi:hypothetical protein
MKFPAGLDEKLAANTRRVVIELVAVRETLKYRLRVVEEENERLRDLPANAELKQLKAQIRGLSAENAKLKHQLKMEKFATERLRAALVHARRTSTGRSEAAE